MAKSEKTPKVMRKPVPLLGALAIALGVIVLPAMVMGALFSPFIVLWAGCALALSFNAEFAKYRRQRIQNLAVYLAAAILVFVWHGKRIDEAQTKADVLVSAIKAFRAENKRYPAMLDELVPNHTAAIPIAAFGRFQYYLSAESAEPFLFFITLPPFGRRGYCFENVDGCNNLSGSPVTSNSWFNFD